MPSVSAPFGVRVAYHPSGTPRVSEQVDGIASAYNTAIYTGTPIKRHTDGTIIVTATGADSTIGIFAGCEYTKSDGRRIISPYWPANETYVAGTMKAYWVGIDLLCELEAQSNATMASTTIGEGINLVTASTGSAANGISAQMVNATTTGATPATFIVTGLAPYPDNAWGDSYVVVRMRISTLQGQVA